MAPNSYFDGRESSRDRYSGQLEIVPMSRRDRRAAGRRSQTDPNSAGMAAPAALYEAGLGHMKAGRYHDAQISCQQALAADSNYAEALHLMGLLSFQAKQYDHAVEWIARAIRQDPRPGFLASLGSTLQQQGRYEEAFKVLDKAVQLKPDHDELWRHLGDILVQLARFDHALTSFQQVLKLNPRHCDALYKSGALLNQIGRHEEAIAHLDLSHELLPNHAPTLEARARTLYNLNRFEESVSDGRRAHQLDPGNADTCNNLGSALRQLDRHKEALGWFDKAIENRSNFATALDNKLISLLSLHRFDEVFALYDGMKALGLNNTLTEWNMSLVHLLTGNLEAGWPGHQARLKLPSARYPQYPRPMWLGEEDIDGKTILIAADEGLGDTIQFVRYAPMLAERGARVLLIVQDPLHGLLSGLSGVSYCAPMSTVSKLLDFDLHCPVSSLPLAFGTRLDTIPSAISYLPLSASGCVRAWEDRLGPRTRLRIGLVWSGSQTHTNDHNRSIPLQTLSRILTVDANFVSLQKDPRPNDAAFLLERSDITDLTADLSDFTETAALVSCLDLVITVDTSVAHLAGALGCPTWMLLPYTPDYRWLLDRDDSPWYPTMRLFRQSETRDYGEVLDRVRTELLALVSAK
jgi:tetratricopeptide (TPR) repeat protein